MLSKILERLKPLELNFLEIIKFPAILFFFEEKY